MRSCRVGRGAGGRLPGVIGQHGQLLRQIRASSRDGPTARARPPPRRPTRRASANPNAYYYRSVTCPAVVKTQTHPQHDSARPRPSTTSLRTAQPKTASKMSENSKKAARVQSLRKKLQAGSVSYVCQWYLSSNIVTSSGSLQDTFLYLLVSHSAPIARAQGKGARILALPPSLGLLWRGGAWSGVPGVGARCGNGLFSTYKSPKILS